MENDTHRLDTVILLLAMIPVAFGVLLQGGYFTWQAYLIMLLALPSVLLFVVTRSRHGWARAGGAVDRVMVAFLIVCALSAVVTVYFQATMISFFRVLFCAILFYLIFNVTRHTAQVDLAVSLLVALGVLEAGIGLAALLAARYHWTGFLWAWIAAHGLTQGSSVSSTLQYRNTFAAFLILPFFLCLTRALDVRCWWRRLLYILLSGFFVIMLLLSQSRGGLLTLLVSLMLFPAALPRAQRGRGILAVVALAGFLVLLFWLRRGTFLPMLAAMRQRLHVLVAFAGGVQDASLYARVVMIRDAWRMALHRPFLGTGAGTYQDVYAQYRSIPFYAKFPHSILMEQLVELGFAGVAAFLVLIGALLGRGLRIAHREQATVFAGLLLGAFGNVLHAMMDFDWSLLAMPLLFSVACGLLISRTRREPGAVIPHVAMARRDAPYVLRLTAGVAGVVLVWLVIFAILLSAVNTTLARHAAARGDLTTAQYRYRTAALLAPLGAEQKADLAAFLQTSIQPQAQDPDTVRREVQQLDEQAVRRDPRLWSLHDALARVYLVEGDTRALQEAQAAVDRNPLRADEWFLLALARDRTGDPAGAARALARGLALQAQGSS